MMKSNHRASGTQRYRCQAIDDDTKTFMLTYRYKAYEPGIKEPVVLRWLFNGSGIRDTVGVINE